MPFFSISGSEFVEMFVGVGAARVRDLFEQARKTAPCIIFIDELDALGKARRGAGSYGGNDEKEQTLNQLLTELDGFDPREGIVLLAATNRPEMLDPALLRAGRFDRQVVVDRPDKNGRVAILECPSQEGEDWPPRFDLDKIAAITPGFTGADLANLVNEAAIFATRRGAEEVSMDDFNAAVERIVAGAEEEPRLSIRRSAGASPITRWVMRWRRPRFLAPIRCTRCRSFRARSGRSAIPCSGRPRTGSSSPAASSRTAWWC